MDQNKLLDNFLNFSRRGAEGTKQSWNSWIHTSYLQHRSVIKSPITWWNRGVFSIKKRLNLRSFSPWIFYYLRFYVTGFFSRTALPSRSLIIWLITFINWLRIYRDILAKTCQKSVSGVIFFAKLHWGVYANLWNPTC
jgi:hypothetical protein